MKNDTHVVKSEWFWASIQMDACAEEKMHLFSDFIGCYLSPRPTYFSPSTPGSHSRRKKRRTEAVRQLAQNDGGGLHHLAGAPSTTKKARSSFGELSGGASGSFVLDTPDKNKKRGGSKAELLLSPTRNTDARAVARGRSPSPEPGSAGGQGPSSTAPAPEVTPSRPLSPRQQVFAELVQTEENYVSILRTIVEVFKEPLEDPKMQLLNQTQMKIIFGNVPPILDIHEKMLGDLRALLAAWREDACIGSIIGRFSADLMRVYPPFVNFFENTKRTIEECDKSIPRFHAFLKVCESRRECGRQTLTELLIRPVQRLGSVSLLLNDLLKHTRKEGREHPDVAALEAAMEEVKKVLKNINEDKRKTEGQVHIFEIFSDIENCPPHLVSSNRQ